MKARLLSTVLLFFFLHLFSQKAENDSIPRKKIVAVKTNNTIKIDGIFDEEAWSKAPIATNFVQRSPENGVPVPDSLRTEVKILYDVDCTQKVRHFLGAFLLWENQSIV